MKQYGAKKATEFTKKQVSVVYANAKNGALKVEKWFMGKIYDLADYFGYDDNRSVEREERDVLNILAAVFENDIETAQELIDSVTAKWFDLYTPKYQASFDRTFIA